MRRMQRWHGNPKQCVRCARHYSLELFQSSRLYDSTVHVLPLQVYYGISFAVGGLGGSLVTSFSVAALAELPSYVLAAWAIDRIGRCVVDAAAA